jgi:citrate synthase
MLPEISEARIRRLLRNALSQKKKISGFGHRVYRKLRSSGNPPSPDVSKLAKVPEIASVEISALSRTLKRKKINANVDFIQPPFTTHWEYR